jgi:hypothetical protein
MQISRATNKIVNLSTQIDDTVKKQKNYRAMLKAQKEKQRKKDRQDSNPFHTGPPIFPPSKLDSSIEYNNSLSAVSPDSSFRSDEVDLKNSFLEKSDTKPPYNL